MSKFRIGDIVKCVAPADSNSSFVGLMGVVDSIDTRTSGVLTIHVKFEDGRGWWCEADSLKIINNKTMDIKDKFALLFTPEPFKSFRKAGITNGDNILTDEGQKIFLSWLLNEKYAKDFDFEVVGPLLAEKKE